jgi:hypothetical protein
MQAFPKRHSLLLIALIERGGDAFHMRSDSLSFETDQGKHPLVSRIPTLEMNHQFPDITDSVS